MQNPYTLTFGKEPVQLIPRTTLLTDITENFTANNPSQQIYMITGVRGAGKTVFMSEVERKFRNLKDWIVVELNPQKDMLMELAAKLSSIDSLARIFQNAKINLSLFGLGLEVSDTAPVSDIDAALEKMLKSLAKKDKKVLIAIDEAIGNEHIKIFASSFQSLVRNDLPLFMIMTGLYENIDELQNEKNLTFLYRAPKIQLNSLNVGIMADNYEQVIKVNHEQALKMAQMTRGYAFAFQVLGYFTYENKGDYESSLTSYKQYLDDYVYDKIWSSLSGKDKKICNAIAKVPSGKILDIRALLDMSTNEFNPYRKRLIKKGIIDGNERGTIKFVLPLFEQYIEENYY